MTFTDTDPQVLVDLADELARMEFVGHGEGHKSSEGDGRTAADIEAENARKAAEDSE